MYNVVIVEDEELEREALRTILTEHIDGIRILGEARNGPEAVQMIDRFDIDILLVDINIPKINGLDVIRHLRAKRADTRVVIITAYDYFEITRAAIHLRVDEYLLKPIRTQVLVSTVQACIQQLGSGRLSREVAERVGGHVGEAAYQDGVAAVRNHAEWIFSQQDYPRRDVVQNFAAMLVGIARGKGLRLPDNLSRQIDQLGDLDMDDGNGKDVLGILLAVTDFLFDVEPSEKGGDGSDSVQRALNYIERNLTKRVTLEDAAQYAKISSSYLSRTFKKSMDINFIAYLTKRRIDLAKQLLKETERSITNISVELSFSDVNYFCKSFKKEVGLSPSEYRRQVRPAGGLTEDDGIRTG